MGQLSWGLLWPAIRKFKTSKEKSVLAIYKGTARHLLSVHRRSIQPKGKGVSIKTIKYEQIGQLSGNYLELKCPNPSKEKGSQSLQ